MGRWGVTFSVSDLGQVSCLQLCLLTVEHPLNSNKETRENIIRRNKIG